MSGSTSRPLLRLKVSPTLERVRGGGEAKILPGYEARRQHLIGLVRELTSPTSGRTRWFAGHALLHVTMDEACLAPSWTPRHLFGEGTASRLIAPWDGGYLIEVGPRSGLLLLDALERPTSAKQQQDVSAIADLRPIQESRGDAEAGRAWELRRRDADDPPAFVGTPAPFASLDARRSVASWLAALLSAAGSSLVALPAPRIGGPPGEGEEAVPKISGAKPQSLPASPGDAGGASGDAIASYVGGQPARFLVSTADPSLLLRASSYGAIVRWNPVAPLAPTAPGIATVDATIPSLGRDAPIVGVLDGGLTDARYAGAVAWTEPPFVDEAELDAAHGDAITRLVVDAHAWNERLWLPELHCRVGVVPVVPRPGYRGRWQLDELIRYIDHTLAAHPDTKVWNLSANFPYPCAPDRISDFGHALNMLARNHGVLFVISTGNQEAGSQGIIAPPADSDAAITVGGRQHGPDGRVGGPCGRSRSGRGPDDMLKPELSWFSTQRVGPDEYGQASSWAAPLVSRLAAHTWARLQSPTPDLVKALLILCADHDRHRIDTGFGSPVRPPLPWAPPPDSVLLAWTARMRDRRDYTWQGIRIPPSLAAGGKLRARVRLVAILEPATNLVAANYFSTRLQASVRYRDGKGNWETLVGSLAADKPEREAREQDDKWQPIRFNTRNCTRVTLGGPELRVQARVFWRDAFAPGVDEGEVNVTFALSMQSLDGNDGLHDEFASLMGASVEAEVVEIDVQASGT